MKLGIVQVNVTDLAGARRFWRDVVGIGIREPFGPDGPFELDLGPGPAVLVYAVPRAVPPDYPNQTGTTLVLHTERIEETKARLAARGVEFIPIPWSPDGTGIAACPYGRFIAFRDPSGNVHELLEPKADGPGGRAG